MGTIPHPRTITKPELGAADLPEQVTVAPAKLIGAAKEGLLALSVGSAWRSSRRSSRRRCAA